MFTLGDIVELTGKADLYITSGGAMGRPTEDWTEQEIDAWNHMRYALARATDRYKTDEREIITTNCQRFVMVKLAYISHNTSTSHFPYNEAHLYFAGEREVLYYYTAWRDKKCIFHYSTWPENIYAVATEDDKARPMVRIYRKVSDCND